MRVSRCKLCMHYTVCAYKEYYTEKEADGIDKCSHFKIAKLIEEVTIPKEVIITKELYKDLVQVLWYFPYNMFLVKQGGKRISYITVDKKNSKVEIRPTTSLEHIHIDIEVR